MKSILSMVGLIGCAIAATNVAAAGAGADWAAAKQVDVVLADFDFAPKAIQLQQGQPYRLHFVNQGSGGHNFSAPEFFAGAQIDPADAGALTKGGIELKKGESRDVRVIPSAGSYKVKCTHFMHSAFGMKGSITVG
jgi:plastocyanin